MGEFVPSPNPSEPCAHKRLLLSDAFPVPKPHPPSTNLAISAGDAWADPTISVCTAGGVQVTPAGLEGLNPAT